MFPIICYIFLTVEHQFRNGLQWTLREASLKVRWRRTHCSAEPVLASSCWPEQGGCTCTPFPIPLLTGESEVNGPECQGIIFSKTPGGVLASVSYRAQNLIYEQNNQVSYCLFVGLRPLQRSWRWATLSHRNCLMLQERLEIHFIYLGDVPYLQQAEASLHSAVLW